MQDQAFLKRSGPMTLGTNIESLRLAFGHSYGEIARAIGTEAQQIHYLVKKNSSQSKYAPAIAKFYNVSLDALLSDDPNAVLLASQRGIPGRTPSNVSEGPNVYGDVPLINWVTAGTWNPAESPYTMSDVERIPCSKRHSSGSYALRVEGDSMTAPYGLSYPDGCVIFVDPEKLSPHNGQHIIAKRVGDDLATFKVFVKDSGRIWLKPLNPQHPPILDEFRVLGTVIGKWEDSP